MGDGETPWRDGGRGKGHEGNFSMQRLHETRPCSPGGDAHDSEDKCSEDFKDYRLGTTGKYINVSLR